jgi:hypothetical protein
MSNLATYSGFDSFTEPVESSSFQRMKEIRLCGPLSNVQEIPEGHYYVVDGNVGMGEPPKITDLGPSLSVTILRHAKKIANYDEQEKKSMIDSTEFRSWSDMIVLYDTLTKPPVIKAILPYSAGQDKSLMTMKQYLEANYPTAKTQNHAYVLYEGEIYRMKLSSSDVYGSVADKFGKDDIQVKAPLKDSFEGMKEAVYQTAPGRLFTAKVTLGSEKVHKKNIRKTFLFDGFHEEAMGETIMNALKELFALLGMLTQKRLAKAMEITTKENIVTNNIDILDAIYKNPLPLLGQGSYPVAARKTIDAVIMEPKAIEPTAENVQEVFGEEAKPAPAKKKSKAQSDDEKMESAKAAIVQGDAMRTAEHKEALTKIPDEWK